MNANDIHRSPADKHKSELHKIKEAAAHFLPGDAFIAGGALTSVFTRREIKDVDIYFRSEESFRSAVESAYADELWCVAATDRAVTFVDGSCVVQLMCFDWFDSPVAIFDAFDFTACMAAYDIQAQEFVFHESFLKHAAQRHLSFHSGTRYPFGSLLRVLKYQSKGYSIGQGDLLRVALCCHRTPLNSWEDLAKAIGGQYGERVNLDDGRPFSIEAALTLFETSDVIVPATQQPMPGTAEELFALLRGEPYVDEADDWEAQL